LIVQPNASAGLWDKIFDYREVVSVHSVEDVVALEAEVMHNSLPRETHTHPEIHHGVSWSWRIALT